MEEVVLSFGMASGGVVYADSHNKKIQHKNITRKYNTAIQHIIFYNMLKNIRKFIQHIYTARWYSMQTEKCQKRKIKVQEKSFIQHRKYNTENTTYIQHVYTTHTQHKMYTTKTIYK